MIRLLGLPLAALLIACSAPGTLPASWITAEADCFRISVPDTFTVIDQDEPMPFADAVASHPDVDQGLATAVVLSVLDGSAPDFWAFDLASAVEGDGVLRGVNVIIVDEPRPASLETYLPEYLAGTAEIHGLDAGEVTGEVIELSGIEAIEARVRTLDGPDQTRVDTTHYLLFDPKHVLVLSITSRPAWMDANRDTMRDIAGSVERTCPEGNP